MIALSGLSLVRNGRTLLKDISFQLSPKETLCITGPSGSGKSLILSLLLKEYDPTAGCVEVDGIDLRILPVPIRQLYRQRLGVCFQEPCLLPDCSVLENVAMPEIIAGHADDIAHESARKILKQLQLDMISSHTPDMLSPGQCRLVSIARALVGSPSIVLLDEPMSDLDEEQKEYVLEMLKTAAKRGSSILLLTRDGSLAEAVSARILELKNGTLLRAGEPVRSPVQPRDVADEVIVSLPSEHREPSAAGARSVKITAING